MLLSIGKKRSATDLHDLVLDCHERIRHFTALAVKLATLDASAEERAGVAASVARYFEKALPLHIRDEDESILPRLRGRAPDVDAALTRMHDEHEEHDAMRAELVERTLAIAIDPQVYPEHVERLRTLAPALRDALHLHLESEERVIVPALPRLLSVDERRAVIAEMRARRDEGHVLSRA
ncbi:hemerythrin domain-containing protein [Sandaracinus amylolyticus]|uniref:hemerythrin domain-containing protein n=1 Tax=Sandaracinus amylolyticus TaxID=927083 RepID=UPI001F1C1490|nr:hemerythrin domain-containing protein [Sandaracinus amylolyticus]UJR84134.1 Hypothetical protein I5071_62050 [Sandaracinus amylolyticus]